jgi:hypothetical protein
VKITSTETLVEALRILAVDIQSEDGAANAAIAEGAERIDELAKIATEMSDMLTHDRALSDGCKACAIRERLDSIGVRLS